jgi:hypothetical protein
MRVGAPRATPVPIPQGRGRWRLTLHNRVYAAGVSWQTSLIAELTSAYGRRLDQAWNAPAQLTFTVEGHRSEAQLVQELSTDVYAWRWDENAGRDQLLFRGAVTQSEDQIDEQSHVVTFTCHDYLSFLGRRYLTTTYQDTQQDQDTYAAGLVSRAVNATRSDGTSFAPGSWLPLLVTTVNPDGTSRGASGVLRDRSYYGNQEIGVALDDLAKVISGFDYDVLPNPGTIGAVDALRIFYPYQGVNRTDIALVYGSTVSTLTRSVNSADYANYWRVLGNNGSSDPNVTQLYGEAWNADANSITQAPQGLWMNTDNAADVNIQQTLTDQASGDLALSGALVPSYALGLRPNFYSYGNPNMGDVVTLIVGSGRLAVNASIRVLGISYDIGDDGQEDVTLTVGRPTRNLSDLFRSTHWDIASLNRR